MGRVIYIVFCLFFKVGGGDEVQGAEYVTRYYRRNKEETNLISRVEQDAGKHYRTYRTGGAKASVVVIVFMFDESRNQAYKKGQYIHAEVQKFSFLPKKDRSRETSFHKLAEHVQRDHVEQKMPNVCMYQSAGEETVPLPSFCYRRRIKNQVINDLLVAKGTKWDKPGNDYNNKGDW